MAKNVRTDKPKHYRKAWFRGLKKIMRIFTFAAVSFFHKKSSRIMAATLTAAAVNLVCNYVFIKAFGYIAAGYTTLLSNLVLTAMHYRNARRIEPEEIYDPKFSLLAVGLVTLGCLLCNLIYPFLLIRYLCIAALLSNNLFNYFSTVFCGNSAHFGSGFETTYVHLPYCKFL